tara:strand:+ start:894 stop:1091 length:198 start_codon:yes stop_codon:yes gene_type:complete
MKYYIYFDYTTLGVHDGEKELVAITDNPEKWLLEHNKERVADGAEPEELSDFEIIKNDLKPKLYE